MEVEFVFVLTTFLWLFFVHVALPGADARWRLAFFSQKWLSLESFYRLDLWHLNTFVLKTPQAFSWHAKDEHRFLGDMNNAGCRPTCPVLIYAENAVFRVLNGYISRWFGWVLFRKLQLVCPPKDHWRLVWSMFSACHLMFTGSKWVSS